MKNENRGAKRLWTLGRQLSGQKHLLCKRDLNLHPLHHMKKTGITTYAFNPSIGVEESGQTEMNPSQPNKSNEFHTQ